MKLWMGLLGSVLFGSVLLGCNGSDNEIIQIPDGDPPAAQLIASPTALSFQAPIGESDQQTLILSNNGDAALELLGAQISAGANFWVADLPVDRLEPGDEIELTVNFNAVVTQERGSLVIFSTDPTLPEAQIDLIGAAQTPLLVVDPNPVDFGSRTVGCEWQRPVDLINEGDSLLTVDTILASGGEGSFSVAEAPVLPIDLEPGESSRVFLSFSPADPLFRVGELLVQSNEPSGQQQVPLTGAGAEASVTEQSFRQGKEILEQVDILFYIDKSGSMGDDNARLQNNAARFMADLDATQTEYQLMVVTSDFGCHNGTIITPNSANPVASFVSALDGQPGGFTEAGLSIALAALQASGPGDCNAGFLREDVPLSVVLVSDEPEQSPRDWREIVNDILALEADTVISAIAGDLPDGCATADPGTGYADAVSNTGGVFLSLCANDWSPHVDAITDISTEIDGDATDTFVLNDYPDPDTLIVTVDGDVVSNWSYDPDQNAIVFDTFPEDNAEIFVTFTRGCGG
ncbi:MAG: choice-of-anchor D domain-containing protein [Myxococcota bacterium]